MRIERKPTLTPISGWVSPGLLCVDVVDRKLKDHIALGKDGLPVPLPFHLTQSDSRYISAATTAIPSTRVSITASPSATAAPSSSSNRIAKWKRPSYHHREVGNSIASRLPARSRATSHRRLRTAIAQRLPSRTVNRATYKRNRHTGPWA